MKNKNYLTVETIPKDNIKFAERGKIDTTNAHIHDLSLRKVAFYSHVKITCMTASFD
jgi:hypothetical protein